MLFFKLFYHLIVFIHLIQFNIWFCNSDVFNLSSCFGTELWPKVLYKLSWI